MAVVLLVAGGVTWLLLPSDSDEAADRCRDAVTERLKAPSTAEFSDVQVTEEAGNLLTFYTVKGKVDAQNSFGAQVRNGFSCKFQIEKSDDSWLMTDVSVTA